MQLDELKYIISGDDYVINDKLVIHNPTIGEIKEFGEFNYVAMVNYIIMRPYDDMVALWDQGIDYETVTDFEMFIRNMKSPDMNPDVSKIFFGDLDFRNFEVTINPANDELILYDGETIIDRYIYYQIVDFIRFINYIDSDNPNEIKPGSESTKKYLIKRMRKKQEFNAKKIPKQNIASIVSSVINVPNTAYTYESVKALHIGQFYDCFYRIIKRDNSHYVKQAIYAGTISSKDVDSSTLEWFESISKHNEKRRDDT